MNELNLIPYNLREEKEKKIRFKNIICMTFSVIVFIILSAVVPRIYINQLKKQEINLNNQLKLGASILEENKRLQSEISNIKVYTDKVDLLTKQKTVVVSRIQYIQGLVPSDVNFQSLTYSKDNVSINANAVNYNSINEFVANLQTSKLYKDVKLGNISNVDKFDNKYIFSVTISY